MLVAEDSGISRYLLCKNRYFVTERLEMAQGSTFNGECDGDSLEIWGVLDGSAQIGALNLDAIRFTLLPAALGKFEVAANRDSVLLRTYVEAAG
jgi:hypothetical protein